MAPASAQRPLLPPRPLQSEDESAQQVWRAVCDQIREALPEQAFHTWFQPLRPLEFSDGTLMVQVPSRFYYDWIEGHYAAHIESALAETIGNEGRLTYVTPAHDEPRNDAPVRVATPMQLPDPSFATTPAKVSRVDHTLNPRYTFEAFIEGPQNQFARAAAVAVAKTPGNTPYNPLLIYGGAGLGKTHLVQAIGNEVMSVSPTTTVLYISADRFTQDFVESIKQNRAVEFSKRYRSVDLLLIDDIHFLAERDRTLMEFFHTFNDLYQAGKQIVMTSDRPPRELKGLDERLVSRFAWGLVCDIAPPDYDTRLAIIHKLCEVEGVVLDNRVMDFLARSFTKNVREMQGALIRLLAHASLTGSEISPDVAVRALRDLMGTRERHVTIETVQQIISEHYGLAPDLLMAKIRTQPIARARMVAMALSVRLTGQSLKQVGSAFGKRDHTTVLHAREKVAEWERNDAAFAGIIQTLIRSIETATD
jgi:chromosomal replication initiator protein